MQTNIQYSTINAVILAFFPVLFKFRTALVLTSIAVLSMYLQDHIEGLKVQFSDRTMAAPIFSEAHVMFVAASSCHLEYELLGALPTLYKFQKYIAKYLSF